MSAIDRTRRLIPLLPALLVACATAARQPAVPPTNVEWRLTHLEGAVVSSGDVTRAPSLQFDAEGRVSGFASCNRFFGRYEAPGGGQLRVADLGSTKMACVDPALMRQEQRYMAALQRAARFTIDGSALVLLANDQPLARFVAASSR